MYKVEFETYCCFNDSEFISYMLELVLQIISGNIFFFEKFEACYRYRSSELIFGWYYHWRVGDTFEVHFRDACGVRPLTDLKPFSFASNR